MSRQTAVRRRPPEPDPSHFGPAGGMWEVGAEPQADLAANTDVDSARRRGRGALTNAGGRFEPRVLVAFDDGWQSIEELPPFKTEVGIDTARKVITRNTSPDIPFDRSINPYRGCEHGCIYCYARPTHAYLGLSPGLDFESKLFMKPDAPELLERELSARNYTPRIIARRQFAFQKLRRIGLHEQLRFEIEARRQAQVGVGRSGVAVDAAVLAAAVWVDRAIERDIRRSIAGDHLAGGVNTDFGLERRKLLDRLPAIVESDQNARFEPAASVRQSTPSA